MLRNVKKTMSVLLSATMLAGVTACGTAQTETTAPEAASPEAKAESTEAVTAAIPTEEIETVSDTSGAKVVRIGHNWISEVDTSYRDPVTGKPGMDEQKYNARVAAEKKILEDHNAVIEWVQYSGELSEDLLRSVLANDPLADMVRITGGIQGQLLGQNVLQPIDDYAGLFQGNEDAEWMLWDKAFDHHFFVNEVLRYGNDAPLAFNMGMLRDVESLQVDGRTTMPTDLWKEDNWTWTEFENYLQKVKDHWTAVWDGHMAYGANYRTAAAQAIHANGSAIYGSNGYEADSPEAKEAVAYIERLMTKGLMVNPDIQAGTSDPEGVMDVWRFQWGHSVFGNLQQWLANDMRGQFTDRGQTMGIVPFPRPDGIASDDERYQQLNDAKDSYAVPKGVPADQVELALTAFRDYHAEYYKQLSGSDRVLDYLQADGAVRDAAMSMFIDITDETYGPDLLEAWGYLGNDQNSKVNEFMIIAGIQELWQSDILGDALYQIDGTPNYGTNVDAMRGQIDETMGTISSALSGDAIIDNVVPKFADVEGSRMLFKKGTDPATVNWAEYITVSDNLDGALDLANATIDYANIDFNTSGVYENALVFSITDSAGNEGTAEKTVLVYNGDNTEPPTIEAHGEPRKIKVDENPNEINWKSDFIWYAEDVDKIDIMDSLFVDLSQLDTTTPGSYDVTATVTDYAGNEASITFSVEVEK